MGGIMEEMAKGYQHIPVLLGNILEDFSPLFRDTPEKPSGPVRILDGTLGLGGHSGALLAAHPDCEILGLDRDTEAMGLAVSGFPPTAPASTPCTAVSAIFLRPSGKRAGTALTEP